MRQKNLFFWLGILNFLAVIGLPLLTNALFGVARTVSMSKFSDLVKAGVVTIDAQKAKNYSNGELTGDWGDLSLYTTTPFLELKTASYTAAAVLMGNSLVFFTLWLRKADAEDAGQTQTPQG